MRNPIIFLGAVGVIALAIIAAPMMTAAPRTVLGSDDTNGEHLITVTGTGKVTVKPDMADVSLGVQVQRDTAKAARDEAATTMNQIIAALKNLGIADDDIQTSMISVNPMYDYNSSSMRVTGYEVSNIVSAHVTDITKVADVIDDAVAAGATTVNGVSFGVADQTSVENQARDAAVKDARSHADALAAAAGVTISGVASISETATYTPWPYYSGAADAAGRAPAPEVPTPVKPGTQDITITVTVSYLI
jgi:uncharacterized protein YggE